MDEANVCVNCHKFKPWSELVCTYTDSENAAEYHCVGCLDYIETTEQMRHGPPKEP